MVKRKRPKLTRELIRRANIAYHGDGRKRKPQPEPTGFPRELIIYHGGCSAIKVTVGH